MLPKVCCVLLLCASVCQAVPEGTTLRSPSALTLRNGNLRLRGGGNLGSIRPRDGLNIIHVAGAINGLQCFFAPEVCTFGRFQNDFNEQDILLIFWYLVSPVTSLQRKEPCTRIVMDYKILRLCFAQHQLAHLLHYPEIPFYRGHHYFNVSRRFAHVIFANIRKNLPADCTCPISVHRLGIFWCSIVCNIF